MARWSGSASAIFQKPRTSVLAMGEMVDAPTLRRQSSGSADGFGRSRQVTALRVRYSGVSHASEAMISIRISTARSMSASSR